MLKRMWFLVILFPVLSCGKNEPLLPEWSQINSWLYQLQNADPQQVASAGFDVVVMDYSLNGSEDGEYSSEEIGMIKRSGVLPLAYLSIGEAEDYRFYWQDEWDESPPSWLGSENPEWPGNYPVKYWHPEWQAIIFRYLRRIAEQGFVGVYLDRVDAFEYWSDPSNGEDTVISEAAAARLMADFIERIADSARAWNGSSFLVVPQNGERIIELCGDLLPIVSGWAVEDLFYDETERVDSAETAERLGYLSSVISDGKPILSVDYVDDGTGYSAENKERIDDYIRLARSHNMIPYAARSDRELDIINRIPGVQPPEG